MVPSDPYGERLFMEAAAQNGNLDEVTAAIVSHRSSYVNESDFQLMSKNGINAVRPGFARWRQRALLVLLNNSMHNLIVRLSASWDDGIGCTEYMWNRAYGRRQAYPTFMRKV